MSRNRAFAELILAASLWGLGFIGVRYGLQSMGPLWFNFLRLFLSFVVGLTLIFLIGATRRGFQWKELLLGASPGFWLSVCLVLQTYGLEYTTVTKSGFITCTYVVFVPLIEQLFRKRLTPAAHYAWMVVALVGAALVCEVENAQIGIGEWLTLGCAVGAAAQIVEVGRLTSRVRSTFVFTVSQALWGSVLPLLAGLIWERPPNWPLLPQTYLGLGIVIFGSTLLAFFIQTRAQRVLSSHIVSLLFLFESPFAVVFAYWLLGEHLTLLQAVGGGLILISAAGSLHADKQ